MNQYLLAVHDVGGEVAGARVWTGDHRRPFVGAKEHIGGFHIINAEDLDGALAWAGKVVEATNHTIEVRPFRATGRLRAHG